jgi:REP element-mobilizing transposase RayT
VRPSFRAYQPQHVTIRLVRGVRLRRVRPARLIERVLAEVQARYRGFRVVVFSIQEEHLHLVVEADSSDVFGSAIRSLCIRLAKRLNRLLGRRGRLFDDFHHRQPLATPRQVRHALAYVLLNRRKHVVQGGARPGSRVDPWSSARWFDGWARRPEFDVEKERELRPALGPPRELGPPRGSSPSATPPPTVVQAPATWLLSVGWRHHGLLLPWETPGGAGRARGRAPAAKAV